MGRDNLLFTSESVTCGHPDKLCDAISDAIVDACLSIDSAARVAVETLVKSVDGKGHIILAGEVTLNGPIPDYFPFPRLGGEWWGEGGWCRLWQPGP